LPRRGFDAQEDEMIRPPFIVRLEQSDPEFLEQVRGLGATSR